MLSDIQHRLRALFRRKKVEADLDEELRFHVQRETEKYMQSGMNREEAWRRARIELGGVEQTKEEYRDARGGIFIETTIRDVRYGFRQLRHSPGFTVIAILTLALGIGVNIALFSFADAIVFRPLPIFRPSRVVSVANATPNQRIAGISYPDYEALRSENHSFSGLAAYRMTDLGIATSQSAPPRMRSVTMVSGNFFHVLGVVPFLGRSFLPSEGKIPGQGRVAVLGYGFWTGTYGHDRSVIGRQLRINGVNFTIVGVSPRSFPGMNRFFPTALFIPLSMWGQMERAQTEPLQNRSLHALTVQGRLLPGVSLETARAEMAALGQGLAQSNPRTDYDRRIVVESGFTAGIQQEPARLALVMVLMALAGLVLIISCVNVASLLLARAAARSREVVTRLAIGAGRLRLLRQFLAESLVLGLLGGLAGLGFGYLGIRFLRTIRISSAPSFSLGLRLDTSAMVFGIVVALASCLLFGLVPALYATRVDLVGVLKAGRGTASRHRKTIGRDVLVVSQIVLAVVLLFVAGGLVSGVRAMSASPAGFQSRRLISMGLDPAALGYPPVKAREFYRRLLSQVDTLPGVQSATLAESLPLTPDQSSITVVPEGYQPAKGQEAVTVLGGAVGENYFSTLGIQILRGRAFDAGDTANSPRVAVVNEQFAKSYWPGQNPIGKQLQLNGANGPLMQVVGVAKTGRYLLPWEAPRPYVYLPYAQDPHSQMTLIAKSLDNPRPLAAPLRGTVHAIDPNMPVSNLVAVSLSIRWAIYILLTISQVVTTMGLLGLILALIGLYGVISYTVSRRIPEFGLRVAIGAGPRDLFHLVLRRGFMLALVGIGIGTVASVLLAPAIKSALFRSATMSPPALTFLVLLLLVVSAGACYLPARRAMRVDPATALRHE